MRKLSYAFLIGSLFFLGIAWAAPIPITFWHSMAGELGVEVNRLAGRFNQSQSEYQVIPVYKGNYPETLTSLVAAFRAHEQPDIAQVFEVGTGMMINPPGAIVPVYQVMEQARMPLNAKDFLPPVAAYYSDPQGRLLAMPFNSSTPVTFYNKDAFKKAGLDPEKPPRTWPEMYEDAKELLQAGYPCGFTSAWPSWIQLEAFSAWHNIPFASQDNGFKSVDVKLLYNNAVVRHHIATLTQWQKQKVFVYGGREDNALALFTSGQCPMLMESSGSLADLTTDVSFAVGVGPIPYWPDVKGAPRNMLIGGAAIWVMAGRPQTHYAGVAAFLKFLSQAEIQAEWQQFTGYLPVTKAAYARSMQQGYYKKYPGADVAIHELMGKKPGVYSLGIRLGAYPQIRYINDQALEAIFSGQKSVDEALAQAVFSGDKALRQFAENVSG